jgi:hypothetical protein
MQHSTLACTADSNGSCAVHACFQITLVATENLDFADSHPELKQQSKDCVCQVSPQPPRKMAVVTHPQEAPPTIRDPVAQ